MNNLLNSKEMSHIAEGARFSGDFSTVQDIQIDGAFDGRLFCAGRLIVGPSGVIKGDIMAHNIEFNGTMTSGNIYAYDTLSLKSGSSVNGDLFFQRLAVELDAKFNGSCHVTEAAEFEKVSAPLVSLLGDFAKEEELEDVQPQPVEVQSEQAEPEPEPAPESEPEMEPEPEPAPEPEPEPEDSAHKRSPLFLMRQAEKRRQ